MNQSEKVYILEGHIDYESDMILGVFTSREAAQTLLDKELAKEYPRWGSDYDSYDIREYAVEGVNQND